MRSIKIQEAIAEMVGRGLDLIEEGDLKSRLTSPGLGKMLRNRASYFDAVWAVREDEQNERRREREVRDTHYRPIRTFNKACILVQGNPEVRRILMYV